MYGWMAVFSTILNRLAVFLEKNDKLKRQIKGAMTYPIVVLFVAIIVTAVLLLKVVPFRYVRRFR